MSPVSIPVSAQYYFTEVYKKFTRNISVHTTLSEDEVILLRYIACFLHFSPRVEVA